MAFEKEAKMRINQKERVRRLMTRVGAIDVSVAYMLNHDAHNLTLALWFAH